MISPEQLVVANKYLECSDIDQTAHDLSIARDKVVKIMDSIHIKRYIDNVLAETGYSSRQKLQGIVDRMIDQKLEQAEDSGILTKKDLAELVELSHKIKVSEGRLLNERIKIEQSYILAQAKLSQTDELTKKKLQAADKRLQLKMEHDKKMQEKESSSYERLLERLLEPKIIQGDRIVSEQ